MDETKHRWYRWTADHGGHFFWALWGGVAGMFADKLLHIVQLFDKPAEGLIAIFTVVLAFSTIGLWRVTGDVAASTRAVAQDGQANLRAFVTITKHRALHYKLRLGQVVVPCVTIRNVGKTQANSVQVAIAAYYDDVARANEIELGASFGSRFTLAPDEKSTFTADLPPLDQDLIDALQKGQKAIFLLATVTYVDTFGIARRTRMRASSIKVNTVRVDGSIQLEWYGEDNDLT